MDKVVLTPPSLSRMASFRLEHGMLGHSVTPTQFLAKLSTRGLAPVPEMSDFGPVRNPWN